MTVIDDLRSRITTVDPASASALLHAKATQLVDVMIPRVQLSDGTLGFRARVETTIVLQLGDTVSADAPREEITLVAECSEIRLHDPVLTLDGDMRLDLETVSYVATGVSKVLWPGQELRLVVGRGIDPMMRATTGRMEVSPLTTFGVDPVRSTQEVFLVAETPLGRLHNRDAAIMRCELTRIPPVNQPYRQEGTVSLYNDAGIVCAIKIDTESVITEVLHYKHHPAGWTVEKAVQPVRTAVPQPPARWRTDVTQTMTAAPVRVDAAPVRATARPRRLRRIAVVAARGGGYVLGTGARWSAYRIRGDRAGAAALWPRRLPALLTALGPFFVKLGQLLSTRRDLLPEAWCRELGRLTHHVPPPHADEIDAVLRRAYGEDAWPFGEFDLTPVASGSIATVHRARLAGGPDAGGQVAVKVRRAGIETVMRTDLAVMRTTARLMGTIPGLRRIPFEEMVGQVGEAVLGQLDLGAEHAALRALYDDFADEPAVRLPAPVSELCTGDTLVMRYVSDLVTFGPDAMAADQRRQVVATVLRAVYRMLFLHGRVHCDLHPGNLYLQPDGGVVIVDAGFVVRLPDRVRRLFAEFFLNMALGKGHACAEAVIASAVKTDGGADVEGFRTAVAELVRGVSGVRAREFDLAGFATKLFTLQRRHGLYAAPEFAFPLLSLLVVEGMVNRFDTDVNFQALAVPILVRSSEPRWRQDDVTD